VKQVMLGVAVLLGSGIAMAADVEINKVYGTELPGKYKHPACIAELDNGDL